LENEKNEKMVRGSLKYLKEFQRPEEKKKLKEELRKLKL